MRTRVVVSCLIAALLAGCAAQAPEVAPKPAPAPAPAPETKKQPTAPQREVYSRLAGRMIKPIQVRPLNVKANCSFRDPDGYGGRLDLLVQESRVQRLQAAVEVPKRGNCAFELKDFRQTASEPAVVLSAAGSSCTVRLWEQEGRVTVAFNSCRDRCEGGSFEYVWPILVDAGTGRCG
jgi:pyruvate/2-oxoglutarate dehydrogenase complex dihydrolipoamide acyltransferase (E2) component